MTAVVPQEKVGAFGELNLKLLLIVLLLYLQKLSEECNIIIETHSHEELRCFCFVLLILRN